MDKLNALYVTGALALTVWLAVIVGKKVRQQTLKALTGRADGRNASQHADTQKAITRQSFMSRRDVHSGWLQDMWPLQQVSIMCWGSPGTLQRDIPDGLRQLARFLRKEKGTTTGGKLGGDGVLRWHMESDITADSPSFFGPDSFGGAAQPGAYTQVFGPHMPMPDRELVVVLLQGTHQTAPETLPHFLRSVAEQIEKGIVQYGVNDGYTGWAFITYPSRHARPLQSAGVKDDWAVGAMSQQGG
ncbi:hypothetical protein B7764_24225 (plasmid) [Pantoea ananatis]|uniref:hypothetical protein n=1 Tax=Pantoea ananas TaxID=553 RepID=UPI000B5E32AA|nr:hypothetical protein [Pantoea ananatis]ASN18241.1 hypothetical protein B7764_24225 [Pantoea ananatis]